MMDPILVIAHEATRTGSPRVLAELLGYLGPRVANPIAIELLAEGPLADELRAHATVGDTTSRTPAAIIVNSASAASAARRFDPDVPALAYVHEEGEALRVLPADSQDALRSRFTRVLCVSEAAAADLRQIGVPAERLAVLAPVVRTTSAPSGSPATEKATPLVIGCGEAGWRKGADLFIDVARRTVEQGACRFEWAGRRPRAFARVLDNDTAAAGIGEHLTWLGELDDLGHLYQRADLLVMTSREDPRPLVPLETALHGVATAAFAVGGLRDLGHRGAIATVPYPDTRALAELVAELLGDDERRRMLAARAADVARTEHAIDVIGPRFLDEVRSLLPRVTA
jgi:glycosyltransferase involved in cell wall biosynthesis